MDSGSKQISMERVETPLHEHALTSFTRFAFGECKGCSTRHDDYSGMFQGSGVFSALKLYIYGGYRCNELGCDDVVFHKECAKPLQEINHSSHPDHPLKLIILDSETSTCSFCGERFKVGYSCSICDFQLELKCARIREPLVLPENSYGHEHPLQLVLEPTAEVWKLCNSCHVYVNLNTPHYRCQPCEFLIHVDCVDLFPEAYHSSHPQHPLKSLKSQVPRYADDEQCLLCDTEFDDQHHQLHHCDVCNFSICRACMKNPPPVDVDCPRTHQHQLHLVPRLIFFLCNACGTPGDRSPYFCLECNFMIHRECIDLPRVININRHDHRISYTRRLGHGDGEWKCRVCRKKVRGFNGAYTCSKCPSLAVHSRCATKKDVWDMVELEGTPEEEEIPPFEVIDDNTIKHFSHDHNLQIDKDGRVLHESTLCKACVLQICSEPFYSCKQCDFILHEKCANLPRKKRHVRNNQPFTLHTDTLLKLAHCWLCNQFHTGFRYRSGSFVTLDVRCSSTSDSIAHKSHQHPLYYYGGSVYKNCSRCGDENNFFFRCEECDCDYILDAKCALLPNKVVKHRYDDHPLFLSYGDKNVDGEYWCEACEARVNPSKGFYACNDCGVVLHISCVVGDFSYIMPGSVTNTHEEIVSNTSICRLLCSVCNSRCKLPSILKASKAGGVDVYFCSFECRLSLENDSQEYYGNLIHPRAS